VTISPSSFPDPGFLHARREAIIIFLVWVVALLWAVPYCYLNGYNIEADQLQLIYGIPSWVFGGIVMPWLWEFHKLHHSIKELDWIGNMRFHWMEIVVYKGITYLPLVLLGVDGKVILWVAVVGTLIGHLNHSNLNIGWGPLMKIINSPRFHVWHHDVVLHGKAAGQNFGILFSLWDWIFGMAYRSEEEQPPELGFAGIERFPTRLVGRFVYPFFKRR
tara:strand:- start:62 stop:715 length:654 start_codon:yes stop_codon:yes gene_type:complete